MIAPASPDDLQLFWNAKHRDLFGFLGQQEANGQLVVRAFRPDAKSLTVVDRHDQKRRFPAERIAEEGFFEAKLEGAETRFDYLLDIDRWTGDRFQIADPYSFGTLLGELDMHLFCEGTHYEIYQKMGAHLSQINGHNGVIFSVWAPNAQRVSVVGDFNGWDGRVNPMRKRAESGVWEIFIPEVGEGAHYKFELRNSGGQVVLKSDPFAFYGQHGLQTASLVFDLNRFTWHDAAWIEYRNSKQWHKEPISIYEVHLGSWARVPEENNRYLSYRELGDRLIPYVKDCGFTHIELMLYLDYSRTAGNWVPNVQGGRENLEAIYFLKRFNEVCYERFPGILTIAEESTAWPGVSRPTFLGGLGFGFKWNMGWMHDFLAYMSREPIHRKHHQGDITFSLLYAFQEHFILVLSHDEVVHGKGSLLP